MKARDFKGTEEWADRSAEGRGERRKGEKGRRKGGGERKNRSAEERGERRKGEKGRRKGGGDKKNRSAEQLCKDKGIQASQP